MLHLLLLSSAHGQSGRGSGEGEWQSQHLWAVDPEQTPVHFCLLGPAGSTLVGFCKSRI